MTKYVLILLLAACTPRVVEPSPSIQKVNCEGSFQELDDYTILVTCKDGTAYMYKTSRFTFTKVKVK